MNGHGQRKFPEPRRCPMCDRYVPEDAGECEGCREDAAREERRRARAKARERFGLEPVTRGRAHAFWALMSAAEALSIAAGEAYEPERTELLIALRHVNQAREALRAAGARPVPGT